MSDTSDDSKASPTDETPRVASAFAELRRQSQDLRALSIAIAETVKTLNEELTRLSRDPGKWVQAFLDPALLVDLGANVDLANIGAVRASHLQKMTTDLATVALGTLANGASGDDVDRAADALAAGMTESATSCTCGGCQACKLIIARGTEVAVPEILRRMRDAIVVPRDRLRSGIGSVPSGRKIQIAKS